MIVLYISLPIYQQHIRKFCPIKKIKKTKKLSVFGKNVFCSCCLSNFLKNRIFRNFEHISRIYIWINYRNLWFSKVFHSYQDYTSINFRFPSEKHTCRVFFLPKKPHLSFVFLAQRRIDTNVYRLVLPHALICSPLCKSKCRAAKSIAVLHSSPLISWHKDELRQMFTDRYCSKFWYVLVDTGRKLNLHKTFRRRPRRLLNVLCTFNLRPVSTGVLHFAIPTSLCNKVVPLCNLCLIS